MKSYNFIHTRNRWQNLISHLSGFISICESLNIWSHRGDKGMPCSSQRNQKPQSRMGRSLDFSLDETGGWRQKSGNWGRATGSPCHLFSAAVRNCLAPVTPHPQRSLSLRVSNVDRAARSLNTSARMSATFSAILYTSSSLPFSFKVFFSQFMI